MFTFAISSSSSNCQYLFPEVQISFLCFSIYIIKAFKNLSIPSKVTLFITVPVSHGDASYFTPSLVLCSPTTRDSWLFFSDPCPCPLCLGPFPCHRNQIQEVGDVAQLVKCLPGMHHTYRACWCTPIRPALES